MEIRQAACSQISAWLEIYFLDFSFCLFVEVIFKLWQKELALNNHITAVDIAFHLKLKI